MLLLCGAFVLVPVLTSSLDAGTAGGARYQSALQFLSWGDGTATTAAATTTTTGPPNLDVGALVAAASPFYVPQPPPVTQEQVAPPS